MNDLLCGDHLGLLSIVPTHHVDLIVTSPPYDGMRDYNGYSFRFEDLSEELFRVLKPGGVMAWVVADQTIKGSETGSSFKQALHFMEVGFKLHDTMIYLKDNPPPVGGKNRYYQAFEYIFIFSKGTPKTFNPLLVERRNKHNDKRTSRVKAFNRTASGEFIQKLYIVKQQVKKTNVWKYVVGGGNSVDVGTKHPAGFPLKLAEDIVQSWTNPYELVLDPMCGSGTTCLAAQNLNRRYIGIDISPEYIQAAKERLNEKS